MKALPKEYNTKEAEKRWQDHWFANGTYHFHDDKPREQTFVIDTPPPTVSGVLHMGHIFSYTQADFVARYRRMKGDDVFYPMGFDDNGLPTERLVEKITEKKAAQYESREAFIEACKKVVNEAEEEFRRLFKSVALSVDWRTEYQTVSAEVRALSQESFLDLLGKGEAYRDFRPTYWDWVDQTAIAQAEIENKELPGAMYDLRFALEDGSPITIATTRPELLGACVAVMYHPEDANAAKYKGRKAITPVFNVLVPMIADEAVDKEFGSGLVMCCTFGDDTDKEWWRKYKLPLKNIIGKDGKITFTQLMVADPDTMKTGKTPPYLEGEVQALVGLKPKQAHAKMVELLEADGSMLSKKQITHTVKCAERSGTPIEIIPTEQWFVKITDKKEALVGRGAECNWFPEFMRIRLNQWIEGLKEDWCISRQRFFGVPFPVWYSLREGELGKLILPEVSQLPVDPLVDLPKGYKREEVTGDKDVMDTWATSSISPQINAKSLDKYKLFPADLRPQAHEIIRTWAFYTIVKAHLHAKTIPWKNLMISGWCLAADKTKMSKSKDNVVTPVALIEEKGTDAVRYWASTSRLGADTAFSEDLLKIGRKLVTKLWNASNFVSVILSGSEESTKVDPSPAAQDDRITAPLDRWILTRLHRAVAKATEEFERFEYCDARVAVEDFFWNDFCDNYLELVKLRAYEKDTSALATLYLCLDAVLRLFAPFVPHVTEEIYSNLFAGKGSIHARGQWPKPADYPVDEKAEACGVAALQVLEAIRKAKSEAGVSIKVPVVAMQVPKETLAIVEPVLEDIKAAGSVTGEVAAGEFSITLGERQEKTA